MSSTAVILETPARRIARITGAWRRTNRLLVGEVSSLRDGRALIEGGVMVRPGVWSEAAVALRSLKEMRVFLAA